MTQSPEPRRGIGRGLKWAFGLSLALNLVFIGLFAGAALRHSGSERIARGAPPAIESYGAAFVRALPREARRDFGRALKDRRAALPSRSDRRALYEEMVRTLRTEPFDPASVRAVFAAQGTAARQFQDTAQAAWLELVSGMSGSERAEVADRLEEVLDRRKGKPESERP